MTKTEWLVVMPDHDGKVEARKAARPVHFQNLQPLIESGDVVIGGPTFDIAPQEGAGANMTGSAVVMRAESYEALLKLLHNDHYAQSGVWDVDNAKIYPFKHLVHSLNKEHRTD